MTWFLPTYGRPEQLRRMWDAPGGMPRDLVVYLTEGDPHLHEVAKICALRDAGCQLMPEGRIGDIYRNILRNYPDEKTYGILADDYWPITPGWWAALEEAAGDFCLAHSVDPADTSPLPGPPCFGGELARAMGTLAPGGLLHNYIDDVWRKVAEDFGVLRSRPDILVEHRHHVRGGAERDATYDRGSADIGLDRARHTAWIISAEREEMYERVEALFGLGSKLRRMDLSKVLLAVCMPLADGRIDVALDESLCASLELCSRYGMRFIKHTLNGSSNIGYARELLMSAALRSGATHVMFVDDDMAWSDPRLLPDLIAADHDFAAAVGVKKLPGPTRFCCQFFEGAQPVHPTSGFLGVKSVGFGLCVIKRQVFEKMIAAYPKLRYDAAGQEPAGHALFCETVQVGSDGKRLRMTEDMAFCYRWTGIGGEIWVDHQATLRHVGRFDYSGRIADVLEAVPQKEAAE